MTTELFIFGVARSGTNLIARLLDAHSKVSLTLDPFLPIFNNWIRDCALQSEDEAVKEQYGGPGPIPDYYFCSTGRKMRDLLENEAVRTEIPDDKKQMLVDALVQRTALESPETAQYLHSIKAQTYGEFVKDVLGTLARLQGEEGTFVGVKEVWTLEFIPVLARLFPQSRFIVVHRDPRAVISSLLKMGEKDETQLAHTVSYARQWRKNTVLSEEYANRSNLSARLMNVKYEEVAEKPFHFCTEVSSWLGIAHEKGMLNISASGWAGNSSYGEMSGISKSSQDRWRDELDTEGIAMVEYICGLEMSSRDYKILGDAVLNENAMRHMVWADQNSGSWRGDSGDVYESIAWEELRQTLIKSPLNVESDLIERLFLSKETYLTLCSKKSN